MSRPPTPKSGILKTDADCRFEFNFISCESAEGYRPSGYHLVHIGDCFKGRYVVVRKLGWGESSVTWLAQDIEEKCYVALKILRSSYTDYQNVIVSVYEKLQAAGAFSSDASHLLGYKDYFLHQGINGTHMCFVFEPMGPSITGDPDCNFVREVEEFMNPADYTQYDLPFGIAKQAIKETLVGLHTLHINDIIHGNLDVSKILVNILPIDGSIPPENFKHEHDEFRRLRRLDGKLDLWAPSHLVPGKCLKDFLSTKLKPLVKITDFGRPFLADEMSILRLDARYYAPELVMCDYTLTKAVDIWCFGHIIFELLVDCPVFLCMGGYNDDPKYREMYLDGDMCQIGQTLGPIPPHMFYRWRRGNRYLAADTFTLLSERSQRPPDPTDDGEPRFCRQSTYWEAPLADQEPCESIEERLEEAKLRHNLEYDVGEVSQLLRWIMNIDPEKRPSTTEILQHPWFQD